MSDTDHSEERFVELESRIAFQERTISVLNEIVTEQEQRIASLESELVKLRSELRDGRDAPGEEAAGST